jgi:hypothetical protein
MQVICLSSQAFWLQVVCLKYGNIDKFESRSSYGTLVRYIPHGRSYRVFNLKTNTVI